MTPDDFTLSAVPLRGPLAPIAALLSDGDSVFVDRGEGEGWWAQVDMSPESLARARWVWTQSPEEGPQCVRVMFLSAVNLVTSPAARSAVVAWLASQGHTDAGTSDAALLNALRAVCGLPPAVWPAELYSDDDIPF